jgi:hypothetical protein
MKVADSRHDLQSGKAFTVVGVIIFTDNQAQFLRGCQLLTVPDKNSRIVHFGSKANLAILEKVPNRADGSCNNRKSYSI